MDSNRLRYFVAVAEAGSVRRAAELLHLSPAAVSKAVKQLEREVGAQLVAPAGRGIVVTDRGRWLARRARPLLDELDGVARELRTPGEGRPVLRLGSFEVFTTYWLGEAAGRELEGVELVLQEYLPGELEQALVAEVIDLGVTFSPVPHAALESQLVGRLQAGIFGRADVFAGMALSALPFVIPVQPVRGAPYRLRGLDAWPDEDCPRRVRYRVALLESALELCRQGLAVAFLPDFLVPLHNRQVVEERRLARLELPAGQGPGEVGADVHLVKRRTDLECPHLEAVEAALRRVVGGTPSAGSRGPRRFSGPGG